MKKQKIILNKEAINNKIERIAYSIIEDYYKSNAITLIGFNKNGYTIAEKLKKIIEKQKKIKIYMHKITTRDNNSEITPQIKTENSKNIFLVDDVLKSGKTIIYGIREILKHDIQSLKTIILINRNHNEFPIGVDYVGLNLSTTLQDHIEVILEKNKEIAYLI